MSNPNNCATCKHIKHPQGGHCYMFREAPTERCAKHSAQPNRWQQFLDIRAEIEGRETSRMMKAAAPKAGEKGSAS